jgi:PAS domain S-box-containing protein
MFGRPTEELIGDGWASVVLAEDLRNFRRTFLTALATKRSFRAEIRVRRADGAMRWLGCEGVPRLDDSGIFLGYTGCAVDITEARLSTEALEARITERTADLRRALDALQREVAIRAQAEDALRQAQKMEAVGQLTGGIAHDFNNMLQGISGALELIQRRINQGRSEETANFVAGARKTVERAAALTNRLLAFARRQALQPASVEPDGLAQGLEDLIRRTVGPSVTVEFQLRSRGWFVRCDQSQLENTLLNLAINSRDAMPEGGTLSVTTRQVTLSAEDAGTLQGAAAGEYVAIAVTDTGVGMDEATQMHAFEPFFTTKPHGEGTGLGLSQVYGFVHQSRGIVRLESELGGGTAVTILLPRHVEPESAALEQPAIPVPGGVAAGANLLLVEDEEQVRSTTADYLAGNGHHVTVAANGAEALAVLDNEALVDLLITDVGLPGVLNGRQAADAARARRPGLKVLFITGYAAGALDAELEPGMAVLSKPFGMATLETRIREMLAS